MKKWTQLHIDVDYSPSDPGSRRCYCDRTTFAKAELSAGKRLSYEDSGGLFGAITVVSVDDSGLVLKYGTGEYGITADHPHRRLDSGGRDYTNFWLNVSLEITLVAEETAEFYREWLPSHRITTASEKEIRDLEASDSPAAKYILGRRHYLLVPEGADSFAKAQQLLREAADAGVADAFEMLSRMTERGETPEDRADLDEAVRLCQEALSRGSELARLRLARCRIAGTGDLPGEPATVRDEIERLLADDPQASPEWYSVLGSALEVLGDLRAREVYQEGIDRGCVRCYEDLGLWFKRQGMKLDSENTMDEGMRHKCAACYAVLYDYSQEEFKKRTPELKLSFYNYVCDHWSKGAELGDDFCAYLLGSAIYFGNYGFKRNAREGTSWLLRAVELGSSSACVMIAAILECNASKQDWRDAAYYHLKSLRYGDQDELDAVIEAYEKGYLEPYRDEIEQYWLPYPDDEPSDGRWDAYA